jgi:hypothetical protein
MFRKHLPVWLIQHVVVKIFMFHWKICILKWLLQLRYARCKLQKLTEPLAKISKNFARTVRIFLLRLFNRSRKDWTLMLKFVKSCNVFSLRMPLLWFHPPLHKFVRNVRVSSWHKSVGPSMAPTHFWKRSKVHHAIESIASCDGTNTGRLSRMRRPQLENASTQIF